MPEDPPEERQAGHGIDYTQRQAGKGLDYTGADKGEAIDPSISGGTTSIEPDQTGRTRPWETDAGFKGLLSDFQRLVRVQPVIWDFYRNKATPMVPGEIMDMLSDRVDISAVVDTTALVEFPVWDDVRVPITATKGGGIRDPGFAQFKDNGAASTGVFLYWFDGNFEEELFFTVQLPHGYIEGTDIEPHIHWTPSVNGGAGEVVNWGIEYTWADFGDDFPNTTIIYSNTHTPADDPLVASRHYYTEFPHISGVGKNLSAMLVCRIFRDATGVGGTDDYGNDAGLLEIDFHHRADSHGSSAEWVK